MPVYQAWGVTCNGCGEPLDPWLQYETRDKAVSAARFAGWFVAIDGYRSTALCPDCDGENE